MSDHARGCEGRNYTCTCGYDAAKDAELAKLREALKPFVKAFERRRDAYSKRHQDRDLGYANFDKMPDEWAMEKIAFNMGAYRRAAAALKEQP